MFEEIISRQNQHWTKLPIDSNIERLCFNNLLKYLKTEQIIAITGVRRAGKSTLIKQLINYLIKSKKINPKNIFFFNLEHPYLSAYRSDDTCLQHLYEDYLKMMQPTGKIYVFLDEVQFFQKWPIFVKAQYETKNVQFVIAGSNAAMVSSDLMTLLSGRSLAIEVFPLSLKELILSSGISIENQAAMTQNISEIKHILDNLLEYGGFPLVALNELSDTSFDILITHARTVLLQDVAPRLNIRKANELEKLYVYLISNISKLFSYSNLSKLFGLSDKSIKEYIHALCDSYLIYEIDLFSYSLKKQIRGQKKIYAIDTGQANAMGFKFSSNRGRLLENLILIELKRLNFEIYYFKNSQDLEVDFVIKNKNNIALMQITLDLNDLNTYQREVKALVLAMEELNCKLGYILTLEPLIKKQVLPNNIKLLETHKFLLMSNKKQMQWLFSE